MKWIVTVAGMMMLSLTACAAGPQQAGNVPAWQDGALRATGNEPGWDLVLRDKKMVLTTAYGARTVEAPLPKARDTGNGWRYQMQADGHAIEIHVEKDVCKDSMTGMPHPMKAEVVLDGEVLEGCAGESSSLLVGDWLVVSINSAPVRKGVPVTMQMDADGRLSAHAGCNQLMGKYTLSGEGMGIGRLAATRKLCSQELMAQERLLTEMLESVVSFDIAEDGTLVLSASSGTEIEAHRMP